MSKKSEGYVCPVCKTVILVKISRDTLRCPICKTVVKYD